MKHMRPLLGLVVAVMVVSLVVSLAPTEHVSAQGPENCVNEYMVFDGDTLSQIAKNFGVDMNELAALNGIEDPRLIYIGDVLCLDGLVEAVQPDDGQAATDGNATDTTGDGSTDGDTTDSDTDEDTAVTTPTVVTAPPPITGNADFSVTLDGTTYTTDNQGYYTVVSGDNLYRISLAFGVTQQMLMAVNGIQDPSHIVTGTRLLVPSPTPLPTPTDGFPGVALVPRIAGPGDTVTVQGYNYPPGQTVEIFFEKQSQNRKSDAVTSTTVEDDGTFEVPVTVIDEWDNGDPLNTRTVSISAYAEDAQFWAMNFFINSAWER